MSWHVALEMLEATPKGKARTERLRQLLSDPNGELLEILKYSMDPLITFGIQDIPDVESEGTEDWSFSDLKAMVLDPLATREITGNAAIDLVENTLRNVPRSQNFWLRKILRQGLGLGIGPKTVNKIVPGTIFEFPVPLAEKIQSAKESHLQGAWLAQTKADGGRVVAILPANGGRVILRSRTGREWENFESVREVLQTWNDKRTSTDTWYLDGEVVSYNEDGQIDFQSIQKTMFATERGTEVGELRFLVFDGSTEQDWGSEKDSYRARYQNASDFVANVGSAKVSMMPIVATLENPTLSGLEALGTQAVDAGWEGIMIRKADEPVVLKRAWSLLKVKFFEDAEATITGVEPGRPGTRLEQTTGRLVAIDNTGTEFRVGSGLTDQLRDEIWNNQEKYIGKQITFKFFGRTDDNAPRHPIFRFFRHEADT